MAAAVLNMSRRAQRFFFFEKLVGHRTFRTLVWWDIDKFKVPKDCEPRYVVPNISNALAEFNYNEPLSISTYGDRDRIPLNVQHALSDAGVTLIHVPDGRKNAVSQQIHADMLLWAIDNHPTPAKFLVITGDEDMWFAIQRLSLLYEILLANDGNLPRRMTVKARAIWRWSSLLAGGPPEIIEPTPWY